MATVQTLTRRFERVFAPEQAAVLAESITEAYSDLVKTSDFNELKAIVKDLAEAQKRTETRVDDLAKDMRQLTRVVTGMAQEMGGLSRSMSYSLENEAYRALPAFLHEQHGISVTDRIVRTDIAAEEINFFALGTRNGEPICLVGESKLQLDERRNSRREAERIVDQLEAKVDAVRTVYPDRTIVRLLVTHYARPSILRFLQEHDILVVQTFEW